MAKGGPTRRENRSRTVTHKAPVSSSTHPLRYIRDSNLREIILSDYRTFGAKYILRKYGVSRRTVVRWKRTLSRKGTLEPEPRRGGAPQKLSRAAEHVLLGELLRHPEATNSKLAESVQNQITPRSAGNYVRRSPLHFSWKLEAMDDEATFTREHYEQGLHFMNNVKRFPLEKRIYVDETAANAGVRRRRVRTPRNVPSWRRHDRRYKHVTVVSAISLNGFRLKSRLYNKGSLTTEEFESYVKRRLAPTLDVGDVVFWDRWGRSGRAKNPVAHHFSPTARRLIEERGAKLVILPPHGKLFDPIEPIFGEVKKNFDGLIRRKFGHVNPSKIDFKQIKRLWSQAESQVMPSSFKRSFKERANGQEFIRVSKEKGLEKL